MRLRYISLNADSEINKIDSDFYKRFYYNPSFILDFLSKSVRKYKIETGIYNMIGITLHPTKEGCNPKIINNVLEIYIKFTKEDINKFKNLLDHKKRYDSYLELLERGYHVGINEGHTEIPLKNLLVLHQQFRNRGYNYEWLWKKKLIREEDTYLFFNAKYTSFEIRMELSVMDAQKSRIKCSGVIVTLTPWLDFFTKSFRKLVINSDKIMVYDFVDSPFCSIEMEELKRGKIKVMILDEYLKQTYAQKQELIKEITW